MNERHDVRPLVVAPLYINAYLAKLPDRLVWGRKVAHFPGAKPLARAVSLLSTSLVERWRSPDIIHWTYYYPRLRPGRSSRTVLTVFDMIHERQPGSFASDDPISRWKRAAVAKADHLICISQHTRNDLLEILKVPEDKVSVTYLGYNNLAPLLESASEARLDSLDLERPYLLYVGHRGGYKNFDGLLGAYASSSYLRRNFDVLCFGGGPFTEPELAMIQRFGLDKFTHYVEGSDSVLARCYQRAALLVYPSLYEGFGIPPLEAMSLGCAVACSNTTSLPEVVGDAAALFDPASPEDIRVAIESALGRHAREALVARGRTRSAQFSWARCAQETVEIYRKVLES